MSYSRLSLSLASIISLQIDSISGHAAPAFIHPFQALPCILRAGRRNSNMTLSCARLFWQFLYLPFPLLLKVLFFRFPSILDVLLLLLKISLQFCVWMIFLC